MLPVYFHPAGYWALLAVPAILAIHFLQQKLRAVRVSTWFLLENLAPDSAHGRTWERLRSSRALWLQLLAAFLLAWVLGEPRWVRPNSAQTVAFVLDSSASLHAFRPEAQAAVERAMAEARRGAARTQWLVLASDPREPALYRGADEAAARAALARWRPVLGTHDPGPVLQTARALAGPGGTVWYVTDRRERVPAGQPALGVGRPLDNAGFASGSVTRDADGASWRALVRNNSDRPLRRDWTVEAGGERSARQTVEIAAGGLVELSARFPAGVDRVVVRLDADDFTADDALPLVLPRAKPLGVSIELDGAEGEFFRRLLGDIDGVLPGVPAPALRIARATGAADGAVGGIFLAPPAPAAELKVLRAPIVAEKHPLLADLNWQGWLGAGATGLRPGPADAPLLWQADAPLAWLGGSRQHRLHLNFAWEASNAARLPATVLLLRRFVEGVRDAQPGPWAQNFDTGAPIALAEADRIMPGAWSLAVAPAEGSSAQKSLSALELAVLRAPGEAGFFELKRGDTTLVRGATQFADARQGDFRAAQAFIVPPAESESLREGHTQADPLAALWLALAGLCLLGSWWPGRRRP